MEMAGVLLSTAFFPKQSGYVLTCLLEKIVNDKIACVKIITVKKPKLRRGIVHIKYINKLNNFKMHLLWYLNHLI